MKNRIIAACLLSIFGLLLSATSQAAAQALPKKCQVLFVQVAKSGELKADPQQPNTYCLTLKTVEPFTSYFTDRPNRLTGLMPTSNFVAIWQNGDIKRTPPNVAMETSNLKNGQRVNQVLELSNPIYDAQNHQISYTAKALNNTTVQTMSLGYTVLFIDDFHWHGNKFG